jgi:hypothetical protein
VQRLSAETAELVEEMKANPNLTAKELRVARRVIAKKFKAIKKLDPDHIGGNWDEKYDEHIKPNLVELNEKVNGEPGEPGRVRTAMAKARVALGNLRRKKKTEDDPDADPAVDADADPVADPDAKKSGKIRETLGNATAQVKRLGSIAVVGTYEGLKKGQKRVNEYYTHKEKGKRRIIGTVLGATALAGIGAGIYFLTNGSSDGSEFRAPGASAGVDPNAVDGHGGAKGIHPELPETPAAPVAEHVKVKSGDSVWKILNEHNGHNNHATGNAIANHQVSVTDAKGHVRTDNLGEIFKGDTVNIEMPQTSGAGQAAHEATQHAAAANTGAGQTAHAVAGPNTEVLEPFNSRTGAGTLSGATLEHVHHLGFELPKQPGALSEITQKVADFNHIKPEDLTKLPIGKQIDFPPQDQFEAWLRHFDELDKQTGKVKAS